MIIRRMCHQFALPVKIIPAETIRAKDGLALSSRNGYLSSNEREEAPRLYRTLQEAKSIILNSKNMTLECIHKAEQQAMSELTQRGWAPDYLSARLQSTLLPPTQEDLEQNAKLVILTASKLGKTRLIDNLEIE